MAEGKHEDKDEKPQEEFVDEGLSKEKEETKNKSDSVKYDQWSMEELRRQAEKKNITEYHKMDRNQLIKNLKRL